MRFLQKLFPESKKAFCKRYHRLLVYRKKLRSSLRKVQLGEVVAVVSDHTNKSLWPWARVVESIPGTDGVIELMRLQIPTGEYLWPVQRFYSFEVGDDHEILRNLEDGRSCVPQPNAEKKAAALLSQVEARMWRGWPMNVAKRYMWRLLGGWCEKCCLFRFFFFEREKWT